MEINVEMLQTLEPEQRVGLAAADDIIGCGLPTCSIYTCSPGTMVTRY